MSRHSRPSASTRTALPDVVPLSLPVVTRLSWELGDRVTTDETASLRGEWEHTASPRTLEVHDVAPHTVVLKVRSPVGREHFYSAPEDDVTQALPALTDVREWRRR